MRAELDARDQRLLTQLKTIIPATPAPAAAAPAAASAPAVPQTDAQRLEFLEKKDKDRADAEVTTKRNSAIDAALSGDAVKDFSKPQVEALRAVLEQRFGKNIVVEDGKAIFNSPETGKIDVTTFITGTFLKSDVALALKPPPSLPGGRAFDRSSVGRQDF